MIEWSASLFVGRQKESDRIREILDGGQNLALSGPFGVGRTALLRHLAKELKTERRFIFLDGSLPPSRLCENLLLALFPNRRLSGRYPHVSWKRERDSLASGSFIDSRSHVIVFDDNAKVTRQKLDFLRWLKDLGRFQIVTVAERFLQEEDLTHLRTSIYPAPHVILGRLSPSAAHRFFVIFSDEHGLNWEPEQIHGLALATHGYPLGMWEAAKAAAAHATPVPVFDSPMQGRRS